MSATSGPNIVENGLVFCVDFANEKSYPYLPAKDSHGISDWYCFNDATITYSIIHTNTTIYQKDQNGTVSIIVQSATPSRGTFIGKANHIYWGDKAIFLFDEGQDHHIVPLTAAGSSFVWQAARNVSPGRIFVYSPFGNATVNYYNNTTNGINDSPTRTITVKKGEQDRSLEFTSTGYHYLSSNAPIIASIYGDSDIDNTPLNPAEDVVYNRYASYERTVINTAPTTGGSFAFYSSSPVMSTTIADGAGGNCAQGLGKSYISNTYSYGSVVSDYTIVCPTSNTITTSYWNGSQWVVWDTHNLSGTELNPVRVVRDGTTGPGVEGTNIAGTATDMASGANLWKWEGTNKFYIGVNDFVDDETSLYGWQSNNFQRGSIIKKSEAIFDIVGSSNVMTVYGNPNFTSSGINFSDNQTSQYLMKFPFSNPTTLVTYSIWFKSRFTKQIQTPFTYSVSGNNEMLFYITNSTTITPHPLGSAQNFTVSDMTNRWINFSWTSNRTTGDERYYLNGELVGTRNYLPGTLITSNGYLIIGQESDLPGGGFDAAQNLDGEFAYMAVYSSILSQSDIQQNFDALRRRFGV